MFQGKSADSQQLCEQFRDYENKVQSNKKGFKQNITKTLDIVCVNTGLH